MDHDYNTQYKIGVLENKIENLTHSVDTMSNDLEKVKQELQEISTKLTTWQSKLAGGTFILTTIGMVVLYLGDNVWAVIKAKLGI